MSDINRYDSIKWMIENKKIINANGLAETNPAKAAKRANIVFENKWYENRTKYTDGLLIPSTTSELETKYIKLEWLEKHRFRRERTIKKKKRSAVAPVAAPPVAAETPRKTHEASLNDWAKLTLDILPALSRYLYLEAATQAKVPVHSLLLPKLTKSQGEYKRLIDNILDDLE